MTAQSSWKSVRGRTVDWDAALCRDVAMGWYNNFPEKAVEFFLSDKWTGAKLIKLPAVGKPKAEDVKKAYFWVREVIRVLPHKVGSSFFYADCFLYLHELLDSH